MNEGGAVQNKSFVKIGSDFGKIMPGKRGKGMKRSILSRMAAFLLIFVIVPKRQIDITIPTAIKNFHGIRRFLRLHASCG